MSYQDDYEKAVADGTLLDPMPPEYLSVRSIGMSLGGQTMVVWLLESGPDGQAQELLNAGVRDEAKYNKDFETYLPPKAAEKLRVYAAAKWEQMQGETQSDS